MHFKGIFRAAFDLDALRINPSDGALSGVQRIVTHVPVRRPSPQAFVRVHPDPACAVTTEMLTLKDEGQEEYLIAPGLHGQLLGETVIKTLYLAVTAQAVCFLWPCRVPDNPPNAWHLTALEAAEHAKRAWVRIKADRALGGYVIEQAVGQLPEPRWPELGDTPREMMQAAIKIAFRDRMIADGDHAVLKRLRGEAL